MAQAPHMRRRGRQGGGDEVADAWHGHIVSLTYADQRDNDRLGWGLDGNEARRRAYGTFWESAFPRPCASRRNRNQPQRASPAGMGRCPFVPLASPGEMGVASTPPGNGSLPLPASRHACPSACVWDVREGERCLRIGRICRAVRLGSPPAG